MKTRAIALVVIVALAIGVWSWSRHHSSQSNGGSVTTTAGNQANQTPATQTSQVDLTQPRPVDTANYKFTAPPQWDELSKQELAKSSAESGIGHTTQPFATFEVNISPNNPKDLKGETLSGLKKLSQFKLISSAAASIDGKAGYEFQYTFENQTPAEQELYVVNYKQQVFSLLFSSTSADFDKLRSDYDQIIASFKLQ